MSDNQQDRGQLTEVEVLNAMRQLSDDERLSVMAQFCHECGSVDPRCQCWNDE